MTGFTGQRHVVSQLLWDPGGEVCGRIEMWCACVSRESVSVPGREEALRTEVEACGGGHDSHINTVGGR